MQHKPFTAHKLAQALLNFEDFPVAIPSLNNLNSIELIEEVILFQNDLSPFEYVLVLTNKPLPEMIEIPQL